MTPPKKELIELARDLVRAQSVIKLAVDRLYLAIERIK